MPVRAYLSTHEMVTGVAHRRRYKGLESSGKNEWDVLDDTSGDDLLRITLEIEKVAGNRSS